MAFMFSGLFWGIIIILIGLSLVIKSFLNVDIPIFRLVIAFILIYWGIVVLTGMTGLRTKNSVVFNESKIVSTEVQNEYNVIFGKGDIDLSGVKPTGRTDVKVNTVFSSAVLKLNPEIPTIVHVSSAFASAHTPDKNTTAFGEYVYKNKAYKDDVKDFLDIKASVVFGELTIEE